MFEILTIGAYWFLGMLVAFAVLMDIKVRVKDTKWEILFKIFLALPFMAFNTAFNWTYLSALFQEFPESMFEQSTARMKRYVKNETGFRLKFATWIANYLNKHDPGHI